MEIILKFEVVSFADNLEPWRAEITRELIEQIGFPEFEFRPSPSEDPNGYARVDVTEVTSAEPA